MANAYTPPGVTVTETTTPSVSPIIGTAADICLVGLAGTNITPQTPLTTTDTMILTGTSPQVLPTLAALNSDAQLVAVQSVKDVLNPSVGTPMGAGYTVTTDYTVQTGEGPPDGTNGTITRVNSGAIASGTLIAVTYTYLPVDYWQPVRMYDIGSVESRFGTAWATAVSSTTGQTYYTGINSQLSMAASLAFANGAQSVICQPLFQRATPGNPATAQQPPANEAAVASSSTWSDTLYVLRPISSLNVIVPIIGQDGSSVTDTAMLAIFGAVQSHQYYMATTAQQYIVSIFGEDGTIEGVGNNTSGLMYTMRTNHAPALQANFGGNTAGQEPSISSQSVLMNNTVYQIPTPGGNGTVLNVGGQYAAAALAGALSARSTSSSMTRKPILGFQSVTDPRAPADKNSDAAAGMLVTEQVSGNLIRVRQAMTLNIVDGPSRSELSVVRSKFLMIESILDTLDNQIIGNIIADANSPIVVRSAISSVLSLLQDSGTILGYTQVQTALSSLNPATITASFSYQPAFPVNYVQVTFNLDLSNGSVTVNSGTST